MSTAPSSSADENAACHAGFTYESLVQAYLDCRRTKRNSTAVLKFETNQERNLYALHDELTAGIYQPGPSKCFVITRPKPREVWAADFRDRIVHHLLYNHIADRFHRAFIVNTCACIPGRGTLYGAQRLEQSVRSVTHNWNRPAFYLKCDLANFFVSIDKGILRDLIARRVHEPWWMNLAEKILFHDPRVDATIQSSRSLMARVPKHKRLALQPAHLGLPIGNLSSQFFANIYLDVLDQHVKRQIGARHYVRYVDDFILLHEDPAWLNAARDSIEQLLATRLAVRLNPAKTILQPVDRGIDFVGTVIKPWRTTLRRRTYNDALQRMARLPADHIHTTANSYFGTLRQTTHSHHDRARLARLVMKRGHTVDQRLTKTFRRAA